jgi:hypothetical protein
MSDPAISRPDLEPESADPTISRPDQEPAPADSAAAEPETTPQEGRRAARRSLFAAMLELPEPVAYHVKHLIRGELSLAPDGEADGRPTGPVLWLRRDRLAAVPGADALAQQLDDARQRAAPARMLVRSAGLPALDLRRFGRWALRFHDWAEPYLDLGELRRPRDLVPVTTLVLRPDQGWAIHRHLVRLRWNRSARLVLEVASRRAEAVRYDAWVELRDHRRTALPWAETRRLVRLFQDLAASYFRAE